ncbi:Clavaminate synthase-like protein [Penicillium longicatenatum]|nr:Clavaminate synthase-like protein [Penicillium longicatenatum]
MPALTSVPTVDLSNLDHPEIKRLALDNIRRACMDWGVFYLSGIPVQPATLENATNETKLFFDRPIEEKMNITLDKVPSYLGYVPLASERTGDKVDYRERIILRGDDPGNGGKMDPVYQTLQGKTQWPSGMPHFRRAHEDLLTAFTGVSRVVRALMAEAFGIDFPTLDSLFHEESRQNRSVVIHYPQVPKGGESGQNLTGLHGHKDMTFGGIIYQATEHECLQAQAPNGEWITCPPKPNTVVYVVGAICESITRGVLKACFHRVLTPAPESGSRYAMVAALYIDYDISLANPKVTKALERIGKDLQAGYELNNGMLEDFLNEEFDSIGMRSLKRYMRSFPEVTTKWVSFVIFTFETCSTTHTDVTGSSLNTPTASRLHRHRFGCSPGGTEMIKTPEPTAMLQGLDCGDIA